MKQQIEKYYPFVPLLLLCVFCAYKAIDLPIHDFSNYYFGAKFLAEGNFNSEIYFPYQFNKAIFDLGYQTIFVSYAPNSPFLAVFFLPFSWISVATAKLIFNSVSIILLVFSIYRLFSFYKLNFKFALLIPILFLVPLKNSLLFGQVYFLLFFLLSEGLIAYEKQHLKSMGFLWSLAILLKVFPMLLVLFLILKKQWKGLFYLASSCVILLVISTLFTGIDIWLFYLKEVLPKASNGEITTAFVDNYQSVFMFLKRFLVFHATENSNAIFNHTFLFSALLLAFKIVVLTIGYFVSKNNSNSLLVFSYWILAMILLSPYGSTYTFVLILFPFLALLKSAISDFKKTVFCGVLLLTNNLPLSFFMEKPFPFSYLRLFFLVAIFVIFMLCFLKKSHLLNAITIGCIVFGFGTFFKQERAQNSQAILSQNSPILIYDYQIKNKQLTYFYWNENGENSKSIPFRYTINQKITIVNNQVYYNKKQLTFDTSNKLKPILIDNKTVLYLSDFDRGIGFYTIRKIKFN